MLGWAAVAVEPFCHAAGWAASALQWCAGGNYEVCQGFGRRSDVRPDAKSVDVDHSPMWVSIQSHGLERQTDKCSCVVQCGLGLKLQLVTQQHS